jgi:hypothetical protein
MAVPLMVAGMAVSAVGAIQQGQAASAAGKFNAKTATANASAARETAAIEQSQNRMLAVKTIGAMRANFASSGLANTGSVADVIADSMSNAELDSQLIWYRGEAQARGFQSQAGLSTMQAQSAKQQGMWNAAGALLGGGAKTADMMSRVN